MPITDKISALIELKTDQASFNKTEDDIKGFYQRINSQRAVQLRTDFATAQNDLRDLRQQLKDATNAKSRITILSNIKETQQELTQINRQLNNLTRTGNEAKSVLGNLFDGVSKGGQGFQGILGKLTGLFSFGALGAGIFQQTRATEEFRSSLSILIKDQEQYNFILQQTQQIAALLGQSEAEVGKSVQQLIAYGIEAEKIPALLRNIQDATAASGKGEEGFRRISLAIGQISASGTIAKQDLNQLNEVFPASQILQEKLGLTAKQVKDIGDQAIPSEVAVAALMLGISERYGGAAEARLKTLGGSMDNLTGSAKTAGAAIGAEFSQGTAIAFNGIASLIKGAGLAVKILINQFKAGSAQVYGFLAGAFEGISSASGLYLRSVGLKGVALVTAFKAVGLAVADAVISGLNSLADKANGVINSIIAGINKIPGVKVDKVDIGVDNPFAGKGTEAAQLAEGIAKDAENLGKEAGAKFTEAFNRNVQAGQEVSAELTGELQKFLKSGSGPVATGGITPEQQKLLDNFKLDPTKGKGGAGGKSEREKALEKEKKLQEDIQKARQDEARQNVKDAQRDVFKKYSKTADSVKTNIKDVQKLTEEYDKLGEKYTETEKKGLESLEKVRTKIGELKKELASIVTEGQTSIADRAAEIQKEIADTQKELLSGGDAETQQERQDKIASLEKELQLAQTLTTEQERADATKRAGRNQTQILVDEIAAKKKLKQDEIDEETRKADAEAIALTTTLNGIKAEQDAKKLAIDAEVAQVTEQKALLIGIEQRYSQLLFVESEKRKAMLRELRDLANETAAALTKVGLASSSSAVSQAGNSGRTVTINNNISSNVDAESTVRKISNSVK